MGEFTVVLPQLSQQLIHASVDLPYVVRFAFHIFVSFLIYVSQYSTEGKVKEPNLAADVGRDILTAVTSYARHDMGGVLRSAMDLVKTATGSTNVQKAEQISRTTKTSPADVVSNNKVKRLENVF